MASEVVPAKYLRAGEDYLAALESLGLHPEFLGWGEELEPRQWILVMVTSIVEIGGPLALNELLFKAYNMKATPKEISPFIVRVFGSHTAFARRLVALNKLRGQRITLAGTTYEAVSDMVAGIRVVGTHCYPVKARSRGYEQNHREWQRFKRNVERLAA
jgi:hypothetical protein